MMNRDNMFWGQQAQNMAHYGGALPQHQMEAQQYFGTRAQIVE
jgi:hypothetical protein